MKKDNEYNFNVRLNLNKPDHRKAYDRLMNRQNQSMNDCVVEALCHMGDPYAQTLQQAQQLVESHQAASAILPTEAPFRFVQPVSGFLDRDFSMLQPQYYPQANYWRVHPGIDLQADYGSPVFACEDGKVLNVWQDHELGLCIRLKHSFGYESVYAGLSDASYVKKGDPVSRGQTIGHLGNGVMAESDAAPHLHFEVWKGKTAVDPVELFLGIDNDNTK